MPTPSNFLFLKILALFIIDSNPIYFVIYSSFFVEDPFIDSLSYYCLAYFLFTFGFAELTRRPWDPPTISSLIIFSVVIVDIFEVEFFSFSTVLLFLKKVPEEVWLLS